MAAEEISLARFQRNYIPDVFRISDWDSLRPFFEELASRQLHSVSELEKWILDRNELEIIIEENSRWRYIRMSCDTANEALQKDFDFFVQEIWPKIQPFKNQLDLKLLSSEFLNQLEAEKYFVYLRELKNESELFREKNIPLIAELTVREQKYAEITGAMTIEVNGKEMTLQQAAKLLSEPDRQVRENVFKKIADRRLSQKTELDALYDDLLKRRTELARNCGFKNYRDFKFRSLARFDYSPDDCFNFHESILKSFVPLNIELQKSQLNNLGYESLRPWDADAEPGDQQPLRPFSEADELISKSVACFQKLNPFFAECLVTMKNMGHLDLGSRKGKAPGGYNCSLPESGVPFIFMNAAGLMNDVTTMVHEGGHAVHSFLSREIILHQYKDCPSEVAELASMTMELFSMEYWDEFYPEPQDLKRAKRKHLEKIIGVMPWIASVDKFQHWIYLHPDHSPEERTRKWEEIYSTFQAGPMNWDGIEESRKNLWQKQLHIFEVPFYYIEYGMAQLGAIAMWRQYRNNPEAAVKNYMTALSLGYSKTIRGIYEAAGIRFDFSPSYVQELAGFVFDEYQKIAE